MNKTAYLYLRSIEEIPKPVLSAEDLKDKSDRTLLYGYTCDRDTWHVYLEDGKIYTVVYNAREDEIKLNIVPINENKDFVPNKRLYPAKCDYLFCKLLKEHGVNLPFTTWEDVVEKQICYGKTLSDKD